MTPLGDMSFPASITILWLGYSAVEDIFCRGASCEEEGADDEDGAIESGHGKSPHCNFFHDDTR
jgi:hypothetical protein